MSKFEIIMPNMGEGVIEATITKWLKREGEKVDEDDAIAEIATDKVDSEIPSPVEGIMAKTLYEEGDVVPVGTVIAIIERKTGDSKNEKDSEQDKLAEVSVETKPYREKSAVTKEGGEAVLPASGRLYSPLVKSIAKAENITREELEKIEGTGKEGRVTKRDILLFLKKRENKRDENLNKQPPAAKESSEKITGTGDTVVEMDRMRRIIADHMVMSKQTSPHVTSFIDVDVTAIVKWRDKAKGEFLKREGEKLTFTPLFIYAAAEALKEFPGINASVDGYKIIYRKKINIGMAVALPAGNLIVPVIKDVSEKSLLGIVKSVNDLAKRARNNTLNPAEIQGGTFTVTNFGSFDSISGTPVINQPQVAILGIGAIRKKPVVLETENGDVIAIRHMMILSLAYDHRVVDGALGGMYLKKVKEILENWDADRTF
jgi:2-oxoglutarate dehydrogenase E2 component (dihydrolipoamide succinyltransferase)